MMLFRIIAIHVLAANCLVKEWKRRYSSNPPALAICTYFSDQWLDGLSSWYEGFSDFVSTNNGLESRNAVLKKLVMHKKLGLRAFVEMIE